MTWTELIERYASGERHFVGADLSEVDLSEANLSEADLREADLIGASLCRADLRRSDLREAALHFADLVFADLREADLREADLSEANMRAADLTGAKFSENVARQCDDITPTTKHVVGSRHVLTVFDDDEISIGCEVHSLAHWLEHYLEIGVDSDYTQQQIDEYFGYLRKLKELR